MNNLYHNEVFCMFIFEKFFKLNKKIEIEKIYLLLPLVFDNNVIKKFSRISKITNLANYVLQEPRIFSRQKTLYFEYLILTTNTLQICLENELLELKNNELILRDCNCLFDNYNFENNKTLSFIIENLDKLSSILKNEKSYELYHSLRIEV